MVLHYINCLIGRRKVYNYFVGGYHHPPIETYFKVPPLFDLLDFTSYKGVETFSFFTTIQNREVVFDHSSTSPPQGPPQETVCQILYRYFVEQLCYKIIMFNENLCQFIKLGSRDKTYLQHMLQAEHKNYDLMFLIFVQ